ncbi:MAG: hypothetical protein P8Y95_15400, partial [Gammaproteobacteria bacterium]
NPRRMRKDFHADIDEFSVAVIQIAISALKRDPGLWKKYNNGDNLLFRRRDFVDPQSSPLIADLRALSIREMDEKLDFVIGACRKRKRTSGRRARRASKQRVAMANASGKADAPLAASWLSDHVQDYATAQPASRPAPRPAPPRRSKRRSLSLLERVIVWLIGP